NVDFAVQDATAGCNGYGLPATSFGDTSILPQLGSWYNVVDIYHKGTISTYINGKLTNYDLGFGTTVNLCPASEVVIGGWWTGDPINFNGKIDEVRLYNRVLTPHEIATLSQHFQVTSEKITTAPVRGK
ncbi:MAG TPA: LamG domain-containing protein, partial [Puia sp.]|nr:LamG domain-containing protein [Puia sp.]